MSKHNHGKRRKLTCPEPAAESAVRSLPTWLEAATQQDDAASSSSTHVWPVRLARVMTPPLRQALAREGFSACSDLASLLPEELVELDSTLSLHTAESILQIATKIAQAKFDDAEVAPTTDFSLVKERVAICKLQPIHTQKSSFALSATEQGALPVKGKKNRRQYFLEILWFVYLIMGPAGLLWCTEVEHDVNLAKSAFLMKIQAHSDDQLAPPSNIMKRWVEWHNCCKGSQNRFWEARATSLHFWFLHLQHRGPSVVHNALRHLGWWKTHVGVPFPLDDALLSGWRTVQVAACIQAPKEAEPLELSVFFHLVEVAACSYGAVSQFCALAFDLACCCLRCGFSVQRGNAHPSIGGALGRLGASSRSSVFSS